VEDDGVEFEDWENAIDDIADHIVKNKNEIQHNIEKDSSDEEEAKSQSTATTKSTAHQS
jgi:hypothetical protein